jgi:hypothetical protein
MGPGMYFVEVEVRDRWRSDLKANFCMLRNALLMDMVKNCDGWRCHNVGATKEPGARATVDIVVK